jgi:hypothetical protein
MDQMVAVLNFALYLGGYTLNTSLGLNPAFRIK